MKKKRKSSGIIIIGNEVLSGKTLDTNSNFMCKELFKIGISCEEINTIKDDEKTIIFHAGTKNLSSNYFSNGGRVLSVTSTGKTIEEARKSAYKVLKKLNWKDGFYRKDIGFKNF